MRTDAAPPTTTLTKLVLLSAPALLLAAVNASGAGYADAVQADGPIAYWRFNDTPPVAVNIGSLGPALNGTYNGDAAPGSQAPKAPAFSGFAPNNTALQLDGNGDFVGTMSSLMNGRTMFTISGWIRRNADQPNRTGLWGQNDIVEFGYINNGTIQLWTDTGLNITPNPIPNGEWAHLAMVSEGSPGTLTIYTNGRPAVSRTHTLPGDTSFSFNIGGGGVYDGSGNFFNGQIDEVAVWDKALTPQQIAAHYEAALKGAALTEVDIGGNAIGSVTDNGAGSFTIVGGGNDIWDQIDEFTYAYTEQTGDFDVKVRVESLTPNARWSKAGIMVRETLAEDSRMVFLRVTPQDVPTSNGGNGANDTKLAYRTGAADVAGENGGQHEDPADQNPPPYPNAWLRLIREGAVFRGQISADGMSWTTIASQDTSAGDWASAGAGGAFKRNVLIGLATSRHSGGPTATAEFRDFEFMPVSFQILEASSRGNPNGILVTYSRAPEVGHLEPANYSIDPPVTISSVTVGPRANSYWLNTMETLTEGTSYMVSVINVSAGGIEVPNTDTFVHGAGYEARRIHVGHHKEPSGNLGVALGRTSEQRGLFATAEGSPALHGNALFEDPIPDNGSNERFTSKIFGVLNITTGGEYQFAMSSDDNGRLYLSSDAHPANKREIAREPSWSGRREYATSSNGGSNRGSPPSNQSGVINLAAGQYYLELIFTEGGGGNNGSATWLPPGGATAFVNGMDPIAESAFAPSRYFNCGVRGVFFRTLGPVDAGGVSPGARTNAENSEAVFTAQVLDGTPPYSYQWQVSSDGGANWRDISGAAAQEPAYRFTARVADDLKQYRAVVRNEFSSDTTGPAVLRVIGDSAAPVACYAAGSGDGTMFVVVFNEPVNEADAENIANYAVSGGVTISSAELQADGRTVKITGSSIATPGLKTLTVSNIRDVAVIPNAITTAQMVPIAYGEGRIRYHQFNDITGVQVVNLTSNPKFPNAPDVVDYKSSFEGPDNDGGDNFNNYGAQFLGFLTAPVTGEYRFYVAADDGASLWLSTDENPANKVEIAREPTWAAFREYNGQAAGGGRVCPGANCNISAPVMLQAGQRYYVEFIFKEAGGGDYGSVAWQTPAKGPQPNAPANGSAPIPGTFLSPFEVPATIVSGPADISTEAGSDVTFVADIRGTPPLFIQWFRDGIEVPGASGPSLSLMNVQASDNNAMIYVVASNAMAVATSRTATLRVVTPTQGPRVIGASQRDDSFNKVTVVFDKPVDATTAVDTFNYTVSDGMNNLMVVGAALRDNTNVVLTLDGMTLLQEDTLYTVTVNNVTDRAVPPNVVDPMQRTATFRSFVFSCGFLNFAAYDTGGGNTVDLLTMHPSYPDNPRERRFMTAFDTRTVYPDDSHEGFGARISGAFIPPVSGNWIFYLRSDDSSQLYLNPTGIDPAGKTLLTEEPGCCNPFSAHASAPQALVAGERYYIEVLYKEGVGGDFAQVAAKLESDPTAPNALRPISANSIGAFAEGAGASIAISRQPSNVQFCSTPAAGGQVAELLSEDFNADNGEFTVADSTPGFTGPWMYDGATGSWRADGHQAELGLAMTSRLRSPRLTVTRSGVVQINFSHRWSFEFDGTRWDGGNVRVSVNGGPYTLVPAAAFSQGGYDNAVAAGSRSILAGQPAFTAESAGHAMGSLISSIASLGFLNAGDTVSVEFTYGGDTNTRGAVPNWQIDSVRITEGNAGQQTANFTVLATGSRSPLLIQWQRNSGAGFTDIAGANSPTLSLLPGLAENGTQFRAVLYIPGAVATSQVATLTVTQPNTPPQFTCGPDQRVSASAGAQTVANWATGIQVHSIDRVPVAFASAFNSAAGLQLGGIAVVQDGVLKLTTPIGGSYGSAALSAPAQTFEALEVKWKSRVGGGSGADGYSFSLGDDVPVDPGYGGEEGQGSGLIVSVDTFDNGAALDPCQTGIELKWRSTVLACQNLPKDNDGSGNYLRKDMFVDANVTISPSGMASFTYDGHTISAQLPDYAGLRANRALFWARTGGAHDNHWVDDLDLKAFPFDASSAEAGQTVEFIVSNDNPSLFAAQPAISPTGTLSYTPAAGANGSARVTVTARDSGGTGSAECPGRDTSRACEFTITIEGVVCDPVVSAVNDSASTTLGTAVTINVLANDSPASGLTVVSVTQGANGSVVNNGTSVTYTPVSDFVGTDSFTYVAGSTPNCTSMATVTVTVQPQAGVGNIGLNFGANEPPATGSALAPGTVAGAVPQANWNNLSGASGSGAGLIADAGGSPRSTTASVTWSSPNTWATTGRGEENNGFPAGGDRTLLSGYLDTGNSEATTASVTVSGLSPEFTAGGYDVIVYVVGGVAGRGGAYTIGSTTKYGTTPANPSAHAEDAGADLSDTGTYVRFNGLTGSSFTLTASAAPSAGAVNFRAPINGIQIVPRACQAIITTAGLCSGAVGSQIISPNGSNACVVLDASLSSCAGPYLWSADLDGDGTKEALGTGAELVSCLPLGEYEIMLGTAGGGMAVAPLEIITVCEAIEEVIMSVGEAPVTRKCKRPLVATLKAACMSFERGNYELGLNQLRGFSFKVRVEMMAQDPDAALAAMRATQAIIEALKCE